MDFSSANISLWSPIIQIGIICGLILLANVLRRKVLFIQKSLIPTAVLAGFMMLILKSTKIQHQIHKIKYRLTSDRNSLDSQFT